MGNETDTIEGRPAVVWWHLHRRLYDWVLHWADTPYGAPALFVFAFAESSFFPVPPDVLLGPLVLGNRRKWLRFAATCSLASVFGGIAGYGIGMFAWQHVQGVFFDYIPGFSRDSVVLVGQAEAQPCLIDNADAVLRRSWPPFEATLHWPLEVVYPDGTRATLAREQVVGEPELHAYSRVVTAYRNPTVGTAVVAAAGFTPIPYKVITISAGAAKIGFAVFVVVSALSRSARFFLVAGLFGLFGERMKPLIDRYFNLLCVVFLVLLVGGFAALKFLG